MKFDAFLVQLLGLVGRGFAVDRAVLDLAVMDLARLFGEFLADIIGVLGDVVAQFLELLRSSRSCGDIIATGVLAGRRRRGAAAGGAGMRRRRLGRIGARRAAAP